MSDWPTLLASVVVAIIAALPGLLALRSQRHKDNAETDHIRFDTAQGIINTLENRVDRLEKRDGEREKKLDNMKTKVTKYEGQVNDLMRRQTKDQMQISDLERLLVLCIGYINTLTAQMSRLGIVPEEDMPDEIVDWLDKYRTRGNNL